MQLRIRLLGDLQVARDDRPLELSARAIEWFDALRIERSLVPATGAALIT